MSCCSTSDDSCSKRAGKLTCPENNKLYKSVSQLTVLHNLLAPWKNFSAEVTYYFCEDPDCEVIYFTETCSIFKKPDIRSLFKNTKADSNDDLICYCFGVSKNDYLDNPETREFVVEQTKLKNCACELRNPSGKCCLKDFPKGS